MLKRVGLDEKSLHEVKAVLSRISIIAIKERYFTDSDLRRLMVAGSVLTRVAENALAKSIPSYGPKYSDMVTRKKGRRA